MKNSNPNTPVCTTDAFNPAAFAVAGREFSDFFDRLFETPRHANGQGSAWSAPASIWEADDQFHVAMDLPGVDPSNIEVTMDDGHLRIHATRQWDDEGRRYLHQERRSGEVTRRVKLPETIDPDSISADASNGTLHVTMQKRPEVLPRKIEVRTSN